MTKRPRSIPPCNAIGQYARKATVLAPLPSSDTLPVSNTRGSLDTLAPLRPATPDKLPSPLTLLPPTRLSSGSCSPSEQALFPLAAPDFGNELVELHTPPTAPLQRLLSPDYHNHHSYSLLPNFESPLPSPELCNASDFASLYN